ncbi:MAG: hypothetical protein PHU25_12390 [Deltaproteobacteria bacterium]|nr:hypothetical protein [Deltaproteobacteria bacterium]
MSWTYRCPHCKGVVNPDETVIVLAAREDKQILLGFHPKPGNYTLYLPPGEDLGEGERWDFYCPICRRSLASEEHENLCSLIIWQGDKRRRVLFSRVAGERATYVIEDRNVAETYGEHAASYEARDKGPGVPDGTWPWHKIIK